jgi:ubiquinone/menaquinone biosynthesis C-methylase UbiE
MTFEVAADSYDRFMGRYSIPLGPVFADFAGVAAGQRVLDVGCGPGALTGELVARVGTESVSAADPSEPFVEAVRARYPDIRVEQAPAEEMPFGDDAFDAALAQLVVQFMADPNAGIREMARVTRPGGTVAACVWDMAGGRSPLSPFWAAARDLDPNQTGESMLAGVGQGQLTEFFAGAGLEDVREEAISVSVEHETFEDWWEPFTLGVGPAGAHAARLDDEARAELRERAREKLPPAPFVMTAQAWAASGRA